MARGEFFSNWGVKGFFCDGEEGFGCFDGCTGGGVAGLGVDAGAAADGVSGGDGAVCGDEWGFWVREDECVVREGHCASLNPWELGVFGADGWEGVAADDDAGLGGDVVAV